ncbi:MAG: CPBP family intramembrane metalloprotease [Bdellovibrionales bacterium]|nr:CPBP family intramembrane metalloprotease [Bdellovibrionales bacterium]
MNDSLFVRFLAVKRFRSFFAALKDGASFCPKDSSSSFAVFLSLILGVLPGLSYLLLPIDSLDTPVFVLLVSMLGGFLLRSRVTESGRNRNQLQLGFWKRLSLIHTGVAVGCIPLVILLILAPEQFTSVKQGLVAADAPGLGRPSPWRVVLFVLLVSTWAGLTEEVLYRGVLLSLIRRWSAWNSRQAATWSAVLLSSALFAFCHIPLWGPVLSLGLFFVGIGFSLGFVASGEDLAGVVLYHILFDCLSLSVALFLI